MLSRRAAFPRQFPNPASAMAGSKHQQRGEYVIRAARAQGEPVSMRIGRTARGAKSTADRRGRRPIGRRR